MYERELMKASNRDDLKRFLMWIAFAIRPLELEELADVVTIKFSSLGAPSYDSYLRYFSPSGLLVTCSSFVTEFKGMKHSFYENMCVEFYIGCVKLAHMSVKDYLVSDRLKNGLASYFSINAVLAHSQITRTCLAYLQHIGKCPINYGSLLKSYPLGLYAAQHWINHMRCSGGEDDHILQMMDCLFSSEGNAFAHWARLHDPDEHGYISTVRKPPNSSARIAAPLYYASIHGLHTVVARLLINGADVHALCGKYGNALQAASAMGHHLTVGLLIDHGANVNARGYFLGNALQAASRRGHTATVQLLLDKGADPNVPVVVYGNALHAAAQKGRHSIVALLLAKGAGVNVQGGCFGNALQAASRGGYNDIVKLLLQQGADVNAQGGLHNSAIMAALLAGHDGTVQLLLENGADPNTRHVDFGDVLRAASFCGNGTIARLLLEKGADLNALNDMYESALGVADREGHHDIVELLLQSAAGILEIK